LKRNQAVGARRLKNSPGRQQDAGAQRLFGDVLPLRCGVGGRGPAGADEHAAARPRQRLPGRLRQAFDGRARGVVELLRQALDLRGRRGC
jgi:hypothetical protein